MTTREFVETLTKNGFKGPISNYDDSCSFAKDKFSVRIEHWFDDVNYHTEFNYSVFYIENGRVIKELRNKETPEQILEWIDSFIPPVIERTKKSVTIDFTCETELPEDALMQYVLATLGDKLINFQGTAKINRGAKS